MPACPAWRHAHRRRRPMASAGTVLITGGGRGIGAEAAKLLAAAGHDVCFTYERRHDAAAELVREIEQAGHRAFAIQ
eukprot:gene38479-43594_t